MSATVNEIGAIRRAGVKGPNAAQWLAGHGVTIPPVGNRWLVCNGGLVLRLGNSEFLIEGHEVCGIIEYASQPVGAGIYKVQRADAAFMVGGDKALDLLAELCMLDLRETAMAADVVLMTQVAGISATLIRQSHNGEPVYRLWCDGTYAAFMRETLLEIAQELGGSTVHY